MASTITVISVSVPLVVTLFIVGFVVSNVVIDLMVGSDSFPALSLT